MSFNKRNFWLLTIVLLVYVIVAALPVFAKDRRLNPGTAMAAIYIRSKGVYIYALSSTGEGTQVLSVTNSEIRKVVRKTPTPAKNTLIKSSSDGKYALYLLTTGEYQVNIGPDIEGKVEVTIWTGMPPEDPATQRSFNIYDIVNPHK
jgi:hypothetical protein